MANSSKLEWSKVTSDPLSAMLNATRVQDEDDEDKSGQTTEALSPPIPATQGPGMALSTSLGARDLVVDAALTPPMPPVSHPPPPCPPLYASSFPSSLRPDLNSRKQNMGGVLNNLGNFLSSGLENITQSLTTAGTTNGNSSSDLSDSLASPSVSSSCTPASGEACVEDIGSPPPPIPDFPPVDHSSAHPLSPAPVAAPPGDKALAQVGMLTGEQRLAFVPTLLLQAIPGGPLLSGDLLVTTYRIQFLPLPAAPRPHQVAHLPPEYFRVPMACIDRTDRELNRRPGPREPNSAVVIHVKDGRVLRLLGPEPPPTLRMPSPSPPTSSPSARASNPSGPSGRFVGDAEAASPAIGLGRIKDLIDAYAFPQDIHKHLFCFTHFRALRLAQSPLALAPPDADLYDLRREWTRQFTRRAPNGSSPCWLEDPSCPWRFSRLNAEGGTCPSYPSTLVVPRAMSNEELLLSAAFRSEHRLPVLTWGAAASSASIWRASQPRVGVSGASCPEDEKLLRLIGEGGEALPAWSSASPTDGPLLQAVASPARSRLSPSRRPRQGILRILDLRSKTAALANRATGHGYESTSSYPTSTLDFCNIGHIHDMRQAQHRLRSLTFSKDTVEVEWGASVENSRWLSYVRLVLHAAYRCASLVHRERASVLLHCSHGWDRTSQVAALAQLFLDPFYRTLRGFQVLIQKDFLEFGHPFQLRTGHGLPAGGFGGGGGGGGGGGVGGGATRNDDQISPIFLQFLDCVWQLQQQHPQCFEFNSRYLLCVAEHLYDCRFGTFLGNSAKERPSLNHAAAPSLWTFLEQPAVRKRVTNPCWGRWGGSEGNAQAQVKRLIETPLSALLRRVRLWEDYWLRWTAKPCHPLEAYEAMRMEGGVKGRGEGAAEEENIDLQLSWAWVEEEEERAYWLQALRCGSSAYANGGDGVGNGTNAKKVEGVGVSGGETREGRRGGVALMTLPSDVEGDESESLEGGFVEGDDGEEGAEGREDEDEESVQVGEDSKEHVNGLLAL